MQKTRLGISVGLLGAAIYFAGLFSGYMVAVVLAGYVLLFEENEWLKRSAVKAVATMMLFSLLLVVINLIPNAVSFISNVAGIFNGNFSITPLTKAIAAIASALDISEKLLFLGLGLKAINQGNIAVPVVDKLISKYM